jgi:hypothetical protein
MTETERIANTTYERYYGAKLDDPAVVLQAELEDQARFIKPYPLAILRLKGARRRIDYPIAFLAAMFVLEVAGVLYGWGCFDHFFAAVRR